MQAKNSHLILKFVEMAETKTESGLVLTAQAQQEIDKDTTGSAEVASVCEGSEYKVGQWVLFMKLLPNIFTVDGVKYMSVREMEIIAVL